MVIGHRSAQFNPVLLSIPNTKSKARWLAPEIQAFSLHLWLDRMQLACSKVDRFGVLTIHTQVSHQLEQNQPVLTRGALQGNFCDKNPNALAPL